MPVTYRTTDAGKWGTGKGSGLTNSEIDNNFWSLTQDKLSISGGTLLGDLVINGGLYVAGSTTTVNSSNLDIQDKLVTFAKGSTTSLLANGGGLRLEAGFANGTSDQNDPSLVYVAQETSPGVLGINKWTLNRDLDLNHNNSFSSTSLTYKIAGTTVLTRDTLGSTVVNSSLTSVGTITSGQWNSTAIPTSSGGFGKNIAADSLGTIYSMGNAGAIMSIAPPSSGGSQTLWKLTSTAASPSPVWYPCYPENTTSTSNTVVVRDSNADIFVNTVNSTTINNTGTISSYHFDSLSDIRFKSELEKIKNALDKVKALTGYTYKLNDVSYRSTGLIAQDVEAVLPESVGGNANRKTLDYGSMMGLIVEAIKELDDKLNLIQNQLSNK